jgi:hypothetical protein
LEHSAHEEIRANANKTPKCLNNHCWYNNKLPVSVFPSSLWLPQQGTAEKSAKSANHDDGLMNSNGILIVFGQSLLKIFSCE